MRDFISIAKPTVGEEEIEAVGEVLRSGMLTQAKRSRILKRSSASIWV